MYHFVLSAAPHPEGPHADHSSAYPNKQQIPFVHGQRRRTLVQDDVDPATKLRRLQEAIALYKRVLTTRNEAEVSKSHLVLVEGPSRRDDDTLTGKTCTGKRVFLPVGSVPPSLKSSKGQWEQETIQAGDYLAVTITASTAACLTARAASKTTIAEFVEFHGSTTPIACDAWSTAGSVPPQQ